MTSTKDGAFCHEVAKRSVARAALHLGIDYMSEQALEVMGDVLLTYLERFGRNLSSAVESSGRTSAHVNVLDAFHAAQATASPTVQQVHLMDTTNNNNTPAPSKRHHQPSWKDLADFVYGPNWHEKQKKKNDNVELEAQGQGGKKMIRQKEEKRPEAGWNAPYLDEVPNFPQASLKCANPHRLPSSVAQSLHPQSALQLPQDEENAAELAEKGASLELNKLPDNIFTTAWGEVGVSAAKRPHDGTGEEEGPPTKRARIQGGEENENEKVTAKATQHGAAAARKEKPTVKGERRPPYVPSFYPPLPQTKSARLGRTVVDMEEEDGQSVSLFKPERKEKDNGNEEGSLNVRSSLVKLGSTYWGSGWDAPTTTATSLQVPLGRGQVGGADTPSVVPLGRASGSRVSKILEGSMDPYH